MPGRVVMRRSNAELAKASQPTVANATKNQAKLFVLARIDENNKDWRPIAGQSSQACVLSGVNLPPADPGRKVINSKVYDHHELLKHLVVKKNYLLKKELGDYLSTLSNKEELSQSEREELIYLNQIAGYLK